MEVLYEMKYSYFLFDKSHSEGVKTEEGRTVMKLKSRWWEWISREGDRIKKILKVKFTR